MYWTKIQHKDGSFDEFYRNERQLGAVAITLYTVVKSMNILQDEVPEIQLEIIKKSIEKSAMWLDRNDETPLLTNHQAQALGKAHLQG